MIAVPLASLALRGAPLSLPFLAAIACLPALEAGFVWDDEILREEAVLRTSTGLADIWLSPRTITREGHYWPIVYTTFWLEHRLWGLAPLGYHAVNVTLHAANSVLAWRLLDRIGAPGAWLAGAVFAVHPVHVESVAWVIERKDLLSACFYLLAALAWLRFEETPRARRYLLVAVLYVAALLSKSVAVTLPAALLLGAWYGRGRIGSRDLRRIAPLVALGLAISLADLHYYRSIETVSFGYTPVERLLNAASSVWFYAGKLLWPVDLAVIYPLHPSNVSDVGAWLAFLAGAAVGIVFWSRRARWGRGPFAGAAFFVLTLSPMLGFVDFGYMRYSLVADRFQYLASLGLIALAAAAAMRARAALCPPVGSTWRRTTGFSAFALLLAVLGALSWQQARVYRDQVTFFSHVVSHNPSARDARYNLGNALLRAGRLEESLVESRRAARAAPADRRPIHNVAEALRRLGHHEEAVTAYRRVLAIDERSPLAHAGLGFSLLALHRPVEALASFDRALAMDAEGRAARAVYPYRARAHLALGRPLEALEDYGHAVALDPSNAKLHANLGIVLARLGRTADALRSVERALALDPALEPALAARARRLRKGIDAYGTTLHGAAPEPGRRPAAIPADPPPSPHRR